MAREPRVRLSESESPAAYRALRAGGRATGRYENLYTGEVVSRREFQARTGRPLGILQRITGPAGPEYRRDGSGRPLSGMGALRGTIRRIPESRCIHVIVHARSMDVAAAPKAGKRAGSPQVYKKRGPDGTEQEEYRSGQVVTWQRARDAAARAPTPDAFAAEILGGAVAGVTFLTLRPVACGDAERAEQYRAETARKKGL